MLTKEQCESLEKTVVDRLCRNNPDDKASKLYSSIALISARAAVMAIQEYEKINSSDSD